MNYMLSRSSVNNKKQVLAENALKLASITVKVGRSLWQKRANIIKLVKNTSKGISLSLVFECCQNGMPMTSEYVKLCKKICRGDPQSGEKGECDIPKGQESNIMKQ
jgi:hypothetical protein